jgi:iron complex outermembrane receptor protein
MRFNAEFFLEKPMKHPRYFRPSALARAAAQVCCASLAVCALQTAHAQDDSPSLQRVEITGSAIKRVAGETALPVQTLSRKQIEQTGATNTTDLIQLLPAM